MVPKMSALPPPTTISNVSDAVSLPSLAVTTTDNVPVSPAPGVPEKVRVVPLKLSQAGRLPPPSSLAV